MLSSKSPAENPSTGFFCRSRCQKKKFRLQKGKIMFYLLTFLPSLIAFPQFSFFFKKKYLPFNCLESKSALGSV